MIYFNQSMPRFRWGTQDELSHGKAEAPPIGLGVSGFPVRLPSGDVTADEGPVASLLKLPGAVAETDRFDGLEGRSTFIVRGREGFPAPGAL